MSGIIEFQLERIYSVPGSVKHGNGNQEDGAKVEFEPYCNENKYCLYFDSLSKYPDEIEHAYTAMNCLFNK